MNLDHAVPRLADITAWTPIYITERPMPASRNDIAPLKAILAWADSEKAAKESPQFRQRELREALSNAIDCLEKSGRREKVAAWLCGQLLDSMKELPGDMWVVTNRELQALSLRQIREVFRGEQ